MKPEVLKELERIFPNTTPGKWKLWATQIMADQDGSSNVATAKPVANFFAPRTWDADMCCIVQRNMPEILADARKLEAALKVVEAARGTVAGARLAAALEQFDAATKG